MDDPTIPTTTPAPAPLHEQVSAALARDLAMIPEGHSRALVAVVDEHGMRAGVAARIGGEWEISGAVEKKWRQRGASARVTVRGSW